MSDTTTTTSLPLTAGTWTLDAAHSGVHFKIRHLGLSNVRGRFETFTAALEVGETLADVRVNASIDLSSVNTNHPDRDAHLLSTDFFGVDSNPTLEFRSTSVSGDGDEYTLAGDLTINGVTRPVSFPVEFNGIETYPMDGTSHAGFSAATSISRKDFGIDFNLPIGVDKLALGEKVNVELDFQFVAPQQP
jgi:polyisoprenoid-binding protein YceI